MPHLDTESSGVSVTPTFLTSREVKIAQDLVTEQQLKPVGIEPLVDLFYELGLCSRGFLGCVQVPVGKPVVTWHGTSSVYHKTVPVWAVLSGKDYLSPRGTSKRGVTFLDTNQFVSWLRKTKQVQGALPAIPEGETSSGAVQALPAQQDPQRVRTVAPLPSTSGERQAPPPSYVSQLGDIRPENRDELTRLESEFRSTPRVNGGREYDNDEYFRRLDALNEERRRNNLPEARGVTASTYRR